MFVIKIVYFKVIPVTFSFNIKYIDITTLFNYRRIYARDSNIFCIFTFTDNSGQLFLVIRRRELNELSTFCSNLVSELMCVLLVIYINQEV